MPIHCPIATQRITQDEFKQIAGEVMQHVFTIHNEFGRFFDEQIYTKELVDRMDGVELEVPVTVTHDSFSKIYFVDALIRGSSLFEFKAADAIHPRHRGQTLNYLLLLELGHGKVINVRPESVGHEFVNCPARLTELRHPTIVDERWDSRATGADSFRARLMSLIEDWGAGLGIGLYEEAVTHFLGGEDRVLLPVPVIGGKRHIANQRMRMAAPNVAFKITALRSRLGEFESHAKRLIGHTTLKTVHWANITQASVTFTTLTG
jgi:GxxExxY protein